MSLLDNFPHTLSFSKITAVQSSGGGHRFSDVPFATGRKGWVQSASHTTVERWSRRDIDVTHTVLLSPDDGAVLSEDCRITVTDGPSHVGESFDVKSVGERTSGLNWMWTAAVELVV